MIGQVVGNYKITAKIGEGGMCAVYKAVDLVRHSEVALKALHPEFARQSHIVERFCIEAVTLAKLNHPQIASVYSFFRQGDDFFIVMEFASGETLDHEIRKSGAISCERAIPLFCQILEGIDHAHQHGVIHRDIKPGNIMLTGAGLIKVMDFGIARISGMARTTKDGLLIGTPEYMSPEQIRGQDIDARSDIYSLGILLYEMLTGRLPFVGSSEYEVMRLQTEEAPIPPRDFMPHIPILVEAAIMRALAKAPEARFQTAGQFRTALKNGLLSTEMALDNLTPGDAAPLARESQPLMNTIPSPEKELGEPRVKETRLVQADRAQSTDERSTAPRIPIRSRATQQQASLLNRLTWKQYATATVAMLVLIGVALGLVSMRSTPVALPPPPLSPSPTQTQPLLPHTTIQLSKENKRAFAERRNDQKVRKESKVGGFFKKIGGSMKKVGKVGKIFTGGKGQK
ncbi:MAG: serine/threonine protein kinase [Acidobacteria bacterium]|nr:serine/threonine protein kinase [Acidobacteriota bacterium]